MAIRVLLVDDNAIVRTTLRNILESDPEIQVVAEAGDGQGGVAAARAQDVDVALVDIRMPGTDGIWATERLVGEDLCRVLILTTFDLDEYISLALQAGAVGFLLKTSGAELLVGAVRSAAAGGGVLSPQITRRIVQGFSAQTEPVEPPAGYEQLTQREREVLACLGRGMSNADIAEEFHISAATVKSHVSRVIMKLDVTSRLQAGIAARSVVGDESDCASDAQASSVDARGREV